MRQAVGAPTLLILTWSTDFIAARAVAPHADVTRITAFMLLVPPAAALYAYFLFGETLTASQFAGFVVTMAGVLSVQGVRLSRKS